MRSDAFCASASAPSSQYVLRARRLCSLRSRRPRNFRSPCSTRSKRMTKLRAMSSSMGIQVVAAFAAVYIIWGSTYLAIRFADETMPPFVMASIRFLVAGGLLYAWLRLRGTPRPQGIHWRSALIIGGLLLACGNGLVSFAELQVPSSVAAVLIAMVPLWMALLDWLRPGGTRPS